MNCQRFVAFVRKGVNEQNLQALGECAAMLKLPRVLSSAVRAMSADRVGLGFFIGQTCALDSTFCTHPGMFLCL
jgi:hypothetical protein